jgi:hypothetical protein
MRWILLDAQTLYVVQGHRPDLIGSFDWSNVGIPVNSVPPVERAAPAIQRSCLLLARALRVPVL